MSTAIRRKAGRATQRKAAIEYKLVEFAYPTSITATKQGHGRTGVWYVSLYDGPKNLLNGRKVFFDPKKEKALEYAENMPNPWSDNRKYFDY